MGSISRQNVRDVLKHKPRERVIVVATTSKDGRQRSEKRIIRRPEGRVVEEWVDRQGNVVWIPLQLHGTNGGPDEVVARRNQLNGQGFIRASRCPLKHGTRFANDRLELEFGAMPDEHEGEELQRPCAEDPVMYVRRGAHEHAGDPCPHVRWLIASRRLRAAEEAELRATKIETAADLERQKLELQGRILDETRATNARMLEILERGAATPPPAPRRPQAAPQATPEEAGSEAATPAGGAPVEPAKPRSKRAKREKPGTPEAGP